MMSFSSFIAKSEALAKQVASQATALAEKAKEEEWVNKLKNSMNEVRWKLFIHEIPST
jgi:hypothetical protein